jgi:hypothetical protein
MADSGPYPGDQFGHVARSRAFFSGGKYLGEPCSYYLSGTRFYTRLITSSNATGSVSWCRPPN